MQASDSRCNARTEFVPIRSRSIRSWSYKLTATWANRLARFLADAFVSTPEDVLDRAALQLLDAVACAAGAHDARPIEIMRQTVAGSGPPVATLLFARAKATVDDAVLVNGTSVRYLDANDIFLGTRPGGHPSDNIPVALAVGEQSGASGRDVLAAIAVGYELVERLRTVIFRQLPDGHLWHEISISGIVAAAMTALLNGADHDRLSAAIAIGTSKGYALREIRRGDISMLKAAGNAMVAREGVLAARLALNGMTGPMKIFEGKTGLVATLGGDPSEQMVSDLCAPPEWGIRNISIKPFPSLGTSQAAISAAVGLVADHGRMQPDEVSTVDIFLPDSSWTRDYVGLGERLTPATRETADHSIQFLVALALREGDVTQVHYETEQWRDEGILALMGRTTITPSAELAKVATTAFPAILEVTLRDGRTFRREVVATPGSPGDPWGRDQILGKFARLDRSGSSQEVRQDIADAVIGLKSAPDLTEMARTVA